MLSLMYLFTLVSFSQQCTPNLIIAPLLPLVTQHLDLRALVADRVACGSELDNAFLRLPAFCEEALAAKHRQLALARMVGPSLFTSA